MNAGELLVNPDKLTISNLKRNLAKWKKIGFRLFDTLWLTCIAEAWLNVHNPEESFNSIEQAFSVAHESGELFYLPEIYRLKAETLMAKCKRNKKEAKQALYNAIDLTEKTSLQTLKLRSLVSLNKLLYNYGASTQEKKQAQQRLHDCFEWFHEGSDTTDLRTARNLLEKIDLLV